MLVLSGFGIELGFGLGLGQHKSNGRPGLSHGGTISDSDSVNVLYRSYYEETISTVFAIEYKNNILTTSSSSQEGQVLEMLTGICDGRDVICKSGTYTMPNVTAGQSFTSTYEDLTGS